MKVFYLLVCFRVVVKCIVNHVTGLSYFLLWLLLLFRFSLMLFLCFHMHDLFPPIVLKDSEVKV